MSKTGQYQSSLSHFEDLLIAACIIAGVICFGAAMFGPGNYMGSPRFQNDNAMGATANAVEVIAKTAGASWGILGILWFILAALVAVKGYLRCLVRNSIPRTLPPA